MNACTARYGACLLAFMLALAAASAPARSQEDPAPQEDLTLPPRIDDVPGGRTRLAEPPAERDDTLEEVVVIGESQWRLPDLGSTWRAREEAEGSDERIAVSLLPLYDAERPAADFYPLGRNREHERIGFIEVFRIEFGRRASD